MKKFLLPIFLLPFTAGAQFDNESLIRIPDNYATAGKIFLDGEKGFLSLVQKTLQPNGKASSYYSSIIEFSLSGEITGSNQLGEITGEEPADILTNHPAGILVLASNKNVRLHLYNKEGKPGILYEFEKCVSGKFLGRYKDEQLLALIKKSEVDVPASGRKSGGTEVRGQIKIYGLNDNGEISEKFHLQNLFFKKEEFAFPVMMGGQLYFMNRGTGIISIHSLNQGRKILDINLQLNLSAGEQIHWDEPVVHPDKRIYLRATRIRIKPAFRFIESWIFELDSMGNKTHETELTEFIEPEKSSALITTSDKGLLLLIHSAKPELYRYDENLNYQWMKNFRLKKTFFPCALAELPDHTILMLAFTEHLGKTKPFVITVNKDGSPKTLFY